MEESLELVKKQMASAEAVDLKKGAVSARKAKKPREGRDGAHKSRIVNFRGYKVKTHTHTRKSRIVNFRG